jgi:polysaccharide biosynthesis transport protein
MQPSSDLRHSGSAPDAVEDIDILGLLRTLWRGKMIILFVAFLTTAYGWYRANFVATPQFSATTMLALDIQATPTVDLGAVISGVTGDEYSMNTEMEVIRSRALIEQLVDAQNLMNDPAFNYTLAPPDTRFSLRLWVRDRINQVIGGPDDPPDMPPTPQEIRAETVTAVQDVFSTAVTEWTYLFSITATTGDPDSALRLANGLAETYRADQIRQKAAATEVAAIWLSERTTELRGELDAAQEEVTRLRAQSALTNDSALQTLSETAAGIENRRFEAASALAIAELRLGELAAAPVDDPAARAEALDDTQLRALAELISGGDRAALVRFDRRVEQLSLQLSAERDRLAETLAALDTEGTALRVQITLATTAAAEIAQREEEITSTQLLYDTFLTRLKETSLQAGGHQADSRILNAAVDAVQIAPRKTRMMAIALLAGLVIGASLVLVRELLQTGFRTADDLEQHVGIAVLGQIPRIPVRTRPRTIAYLAEKPTSAAAEAIRNLRTSILLSNVDKPPQVILPTSSIPGEGKTTLAIALAQNLAGLEKRVILIEGDIRRRTFGAYFPDAAGKPGLLSVISHKVPMADAVYRHPTLGIDVLMGERSTVNAADVFSSASFRDLVTGLRDSYDFIIIDTPPVLVVPDARVIASLADSVIYVVNWDRTSRTQVTEGLKQLSTVNVPVTGMVLSQIDPRGMRRYGYGTYHGAYSRYAKGYYDT